MSKTILILAAAALTSLPASAEAPLLQKRSLGLAASHRVMAAAMAEARRLNAPGGVIAIVDDGGNLVHLERMDGTFAAGANISIGKARTAALFKRPTRAFEEIIKNGRIALVALSDFTPLQGGVPISAGGEVVGAIGVSGAASVQQDEEIALAGARALEAISAPPVPSSAVPVEFFDRSQVEAAFARGAVLLGSQPGRSYEIHASRREAAGMAEIHLADTDVIYVLKGTAVFVTGGTVTDGTQIAPGEIRGAIIQGGTERRLSPGDVIVVPRGTPHWFKEVQGPLTYYVVKVR